MTDMEQKYIDLFWAKVDKSGNCWNWTAAKDIDGYGKYSIAKKGSWRAHRFSLLVSGVEIPEGKIVLHHCDNPSCVNPAHLSVGTVQDNNLDKLKNVS